MQMICNNAWAVAPCLSMEHRKNCTFGGHTSQCFMCVMEKFVYDYWKGRKKEMTVDFYRVFREMYPDLAIYSNYEQQDPQSFYGTILMTAEQSHLATAPGTNGKQ